MLRSLKLPTVKHYLIIRFIYDTEKTMAERFELFKRLTLPSIENQTNMDFVPVMLVSHNCKVQMPLPWEVITADSYDLKHYRELIKDFIIQDAKDAHRIVTTRLDNDDIIHPMFINIIQDSVRIFSHNYLIDAPGYWLDLRGKDPRLYRNDYYYYSASPFLSVVSSIDNLKICFEAPHGKIRDTLVWRLVNPSRSWAQTLHSSNKKMNRLKSNKLGSEVEGFQNSFDWIKRITLH